MGEGATHSVAVDSRHGGGGGGGGEMYVVTDLVKETPL